MTRADPYRWHDIEWTLAYTNEDQLRALVRYQAAQLDRLTNGTYEPPTDPEPPAPEVIDAVETLLWRDDIHRRPPRVAAPRLLRGLADQGLTIRHTPGGD